MDRRACSMSLCLVNSQTTRLPFYVLLDFLFLRFFLPVLAISNALCESKDCFGFTFNIAPFRNGHSLRSSELNLRLSRFFQFISLFFHSRHKLVYNNWDVPIFPTNKKKLKNKRKQGNNNMSIGVKIEITIKMIK